MDTSDTRRRTSSGARSQTSFVNGFLVTSLAFCAAHGLFLGVILFVLNHNGEGSLADVDWRSVGFGCLSVLVVLAIDFVVDLPGLRQWSFLQIEQTANRGLGRSRRRPSHADLRPVWVAMTGASSALFGVFVVLKTLYALSTGSASVGAGHGARLAQPRDEPPAQCAPGTEVRGPVGQGPRRRSRTARAKRTAVDRRAQADKS